MRLFGYKINDIDLTDCRIIGSLIGSITGLALCNSSSSKERSATHKDVKFHEKTEKEANREAEYWKEDHRE